jgi:TRAP-type C4-dicarboxylate transport system permease small subunit
MVFAAVAISLAMKLLVAWCGWMRWEPNSDFTAVGAIALQIDRYATMLAIIAALIASAYIGTRRAPGRINTSYQKQLDRCIVPSEHAFMI